MAHQCSGRYGVIAIMLHWLIAIFIAAQIFVGLWMVDAIRQPASRILALQAYQWHKSLGLTLLILSLARLLWRLFNRPPPLPESMSRPEMLGAHAVHWLFYVLMIAIPLLGWAMVSAAPFAVPIKVFGTFQWPSFPWVRALDNKAMLGTVVQLSHRYAAYFLVLLAGLHVAAALRHHVFSRDDVLARMIPWVRTRRSPTGGRRGLEP